MDGKGDERLERGGTRVTEPSGLMDAVKNELNPESGTVAALNHGLRIQAALPIQ